MVDAESLNVLNQVSTREDGCSSDIDISQGRLREFRSGRSAMKILIDPASHKLSLSLKKVDRRETPVSKKLIGAKLWSENKMIGKKLKTQKSRSRSPLRC
jgi:hypothetical protein